MDHPCKGVLLSLQSVLLEMLVSFLASCTLPSVASEGLTTFNTMHSELLLGVIVTHSMSCRSPNGCCRQFVLSFSPVL